ncbi:hypothetical protein FHG87_024456, partial [Trinorchestia longiramus]
ELAEPSGLSRHDLRRRQEYSDSELLRPGFVRLGLSFTASDEEVEFVLRSVELVCRDGWKLLPQYICNHQTGEWKHRRQQVFKGRQWLGNVSYAGGVFSVRHQEPVKDGASYKNCLAAAQQAFLHASKVVRQFPDTSADQLILSPESQQLRWFMMPSEARQLLLKENACHSAILGSHSTDEARFSNSRESGFSSSIMENAANSMQDSFNALGTKNLTSMNILTNSSSISLIDGNTESEFSAASALQSSVANSSVSVPFNPPCYPLNGAVLISRPTYIWHQPPRLHYWPVQTHSSSTPEDEVLNDDRVKIGAVSGSVNNIICYPEDNENRFDVNDKKNIINSDAGQIEIDVLNLSLSDECSAASLDISQVNEKNIQTHSRRNLLSQKTECCDNGRERSIEGSNFNSSLKKSSTMHASCQDPSPLKKQSRSTDGDEISNKIDRTKVIKRKVKEDGINDTETTSKVESRNSKDVHSSEVQVNFSAETEAVQESSKHPEGLKNGVVVQDFNSQELTASTAGTVTFKGKNISSRAKEALRVREESPAGKKVVCSDMKCFLPRPDGDLPQLQLKAKWHSPPKHLFNPMVEAMEQFKMIRDGDRVLLCLSGGKDSLSLLHLLHQYQFYAR